MDKGFKNKGKVLLFVMPSDEHAKDFMLWLSNAGEQDYWDTMEVQEKEMVTFDYDYGNLSINCEIVEGEE